MSTQHLIDLGDENPPSANCTKCGTALMPTSRTRGICPNCPDGKLVRLPEAMHGKYEQVARRAERQERERVRRENMTPAEKLMEGLKSGKIRIDVSGILGKKGGQSK